MTGRDVIDDTSRQAARRAMERSDLYGLLAAVFRREPTAALLRQLAAPELSEALRQAGLKLEVPAAANGAMEELAIEYARLFVGPGTHLPPYESVYVDERLASRTTDEVAHFIEGHGFAYRPGYHDLPDHLGVELEFVQGLAREEAEAWKRGDLATAGERVETQDQFIAAHLLRWLPAFCADVVENARLPFYREFAGFLGDFISHEGEMPDRAPGDCVR